MIPLVGGFRSLGSRRRFRRALGWLSLGALAPALFACNARTVERPDIVPSMTDKSTVSLVANRNVDLLFLIDDSSSMKLSQDNLRRNFPAFMTALKNLPGGLPNVHIAIASSDMGAGDGTINACGPTGGGKGGIFQYAPRGDCVATGLDAGATYISDVNGVRNYTGSLEDVFTCMAALGQEGCGFEHQFAAITRALGADGQAPPSENQGFLRDDAYLAIVMITNEDDCSASPGVGLFENSANTTIDSQLGPPIGFRCNEYGHICDGVHPDRHAPNGDVNATRTYGSCVSAEDGVLRNVADVAAGIKKLKTDPDNQIVFAAISGLAAPYTVHWKSPPPGSDTKPWPEISHYRTAADGSFADPSPRISQLVREFGSNGLQLDICGGEFSGALSRIADKIADRIRKPCITGQVAKKPGTAIDDCTVTSFSPDDSGKVIEQPIAACADTNGAGPCWQLAAGENGCAGQTIAVVPDPAVPPPIWENAGVQCALCTPGVTDAARGCP
jgi:hypothetical protein